ncbi:MAG: SGNH/GDSL hydrolase family protein [Cyanobacteria bacterium J06641_5]
MLASLPIVGFILGCEVENRIVADMAAGDILVLGDSVMEWNVDEDAAIADFIASELDRTVVNAGVAGAWLSIPDKVAELGPLGYDIRAQYRPRSWGWVVMDGGANDLGEECGCGLCQATLDELVSTDGLRGQYPDFVRSVVEDNSRVLVMGYYMPPVGAETEFTDCTNDFVELNERLAWMAASIDGVYFAAAADAIDPTDRTSYDPDLVHPSPQGARSIGKLLAQTILDAERGQQH